MTDLSVYDAATGSCIMCGADSEGSLYWIGMDQEQWLIIRPHIVHMFPVSPWSDERLVGKIFFIPPFDRPLCGAVCSLVYKEKEDEKV